MRWTRGMVQKYKEEVSKTALCKECRERIEKETGVTLTRVPNPSEWEEAQRTAVGRLLRGFEK